MDETDVIKVWPFHLAPKELQGLSGHGGDEDWLALLPPGVDHPLWAESGTSFGRCDVSSHKLLNGYTVLIGAHA